MQEPANPSFNEPESAVQPRVAVIVPAWGVAHLVGEALDSILAQRFEDWECVVIDDGAPDDVADAVSAYLNDPRIRFLPTSNRGVSAARNRAIAECSAPLITLLDGDDRLRPEYLATMVTLLEQDPAIRIATSNALLFGAVGRESPSLLAGQGSADPERGTLAEVINRSFSVHITSTFRRTDFEAIGGFDTAMAQSEDFDLWLRLLARGGHARYVDAILCDYRVRQGSASADPARLYIGNIRAYEKLAAALPADDPVQDELAAMIAQCRDALSFEHAVDRVIDGDTRGGLSALRGARGQVGGPVWSAAFALWRVFPRLARPMLRRRRRTHSRGYVPGGLRKLLRSGEA